MRPPRSSNFAKQRYSKADFEVDFDHHPQQRWYRETSTDLATPAGRQIRRQRVAVEHALARVGSIQGTRAGFRGPDKNNFDLERVAIVANCHVLRPLLDQAAQRFLVTSVAPGD